MFVVLMLGLPLFWDNSRDDMNLLNEFRTSYIWIIEYNKDIRVIDICKKILKTIFLSHNV